WVPRLVRTRAAQIDKAERAFYARHGRRPSEDELADLLGADDMQFEKIRRDGKAVAQVSLERKWFETDSNKDVREVDVIEDDRQVSPFVETHKQDLRDLITKGLTRAERLIVLLYYYEEMTMKEIGQTLDLSESRVSQMHTSILQRLRSRLGHREREFYHA
ncbi:MAG: sigma-70 family RNA polymerase sigma factor, partial [Planctomycetota bacterium]